VKSSSGEVRYPSGRATRDSGGRCYHETGAEMPPCPRAVSMRERLAGGETVAYELDILQGTIDLRDVRFRFPSAGVVTVLSANLVSGDSIAASCASGPPARR
jgi:hypothetical protein